MRTTVFFARSFALAVSGLLAACAGHAASTPATPANTTPQSFAEVAGVPTTLSGANQTVSLPSVPGVSSVGGSIVVTSGAPVTAVMSIASSSAGGSSAGPPVALTSSGRRSAQDFSGTTTTPQYYIGVTNTSGASQQVTFSSLTLNVNVPAGQSVGLAHYDPSQPQNGWNQHCAFGSNQVTQNGSTTTFTPNASITIYPGATLWFAPYTYPATTVSPTPPPSGGGIVPTPAPAPASVTGTYIGSAQSTSPSVKAAQYLEFQITQSGGNVTGTYAVLPNGQNSNGAFGTVSGTVAAGTLTLTANQQYGGSCGPALNLTASGVLISGTFTGGAGCDSGVVSAVLQSASLPMISGTYSGSLSDAVNGSGTLTVTVSQPGTVWSGTAASSYPGNPGANNTSAIVGFVTDSTTTEFAIVAGAVNACNPFGTATISGNTLMGSYSGSAASNNSCTAGGSFTISN